MMESVRRTSGSLSEVLEMIKLRLQSQVLGPKLKAALDAEAAARQELHVAELTYRRGKDKVDRLVGHIRHNSIIGFSGILIISSGRFVKV